MSLSAMVAVAQGRIKEASEESRRCLMVEKVD
jgi:hypothetical protein